MEDSEEEEGEEEYDPNAFDIDLEKTPPESKRKLENSDKLDLHDSSEVSKSVEKKRKPVIDFEFDSLADTDKTTSLLTSTIAKMDPLSKVVALTKAKLDREEA